MKKRAQPETTESSAALCTLEQRLEDILKSHKLRGRLWPNGMPPVPFDAARWWMARQEPRKPWEKQMRVKIPIKLGEAEKFRIVDAYADRLILNLRVFLQLSAKSQRLIMAAWEDGIWWRGEDTQERLPQFAGMTHLEFIISETERMKAMGIGIEAYREEVKKKARGMIRGMQA